MKDMAAIADILERGQWQESAATVRAAQARIVELEEDNGRLRDIVELETCCRCGLPRSEHTGDGSGGRAWRELHCPSPVKHPARP